MPHPIRPMVLIAALAIAGFGPAFAQEDGWSSSYQMGTLAVGVSTSEKARLTFYCGDKAAARANRLIKGGPYLDVSLPKATGLDQAATLDLVVDGRGVSIPVKATVEGDSVTLSWEPSPRFGTKQMKAVAARLAKARTASIHAGGRTVTLPMAGAAKALADDPLGC